MGIKSELFLSQSKVRQIYSAYHCALLTPFLHLAASLCYAISAASDWLWNYSSWHGLTITVLLQFNCLFGLVPVPLVDLLVAQMQVLGQLLDACLGPLGIQFECSLEHLLLGPGQPGHMLFQGSLTIHDAVTFWGSILLDDAFIARVGWLWWHGLVVMHGCDDLAYCGFEFLNCFIWRILVRAVLI